MTSFGDLNAAVRHLVDLSRADELPFAWFELGPRDDAIFVAVERSDEAAASDFFRDARLTLDDGSPIAVVMETRAGRGWSSEPITGETPTPDPAAIEDLIGLDVDTAAARANGGGWSVRAYERAAMLTADYRPNRVNLLVDDDNKVARAGIG